MEWQKESSDPHEFMESLKIDLYADEVFVFTPKGDVLALPRGATPLDFAYSIHTEVGHRTVGSRVNGRLVPLAHELTSGDSVEIITAKGRSVSVAGLAAGRQDASSTKQDPTVVRARATRGRAGSRAGCVVSRPCASKVFRSTKSRSETSSRISRRS